MRELQIEMEYITGARGYILEQSQEPHFNYCIRYSLQIDALTNMEELHIQTVSATKRHPHFHIWAPVPLQYGASIFVTEVQPNDP